MTPTSTMKRMNTVGLPWCLRREGVDADQWEVSQCAVAGPAMESAALTECPQVEGDGDPCLPHVEITMKWAPAEVLLHHTRVGLVEGVAVDATCQWDTHTEGKRWAEITYSLFSCFAFSCAQISLVPRHVHLSEFVIIRIHCPSCKHSLICWIL